MIERRIINIPVRLIGKARRAGDPQVRVESLPEVLERLAKALTELEDRHIGSGR